MKLEDFFYVVGERVESAAVKLSGAFRELLFPSPRELPPDFRLLRRLVKKSITIHEFLSLKLQLVFLAYLLLNLLILLLIRSIPLLMLTALVYFLYIHRLLWRNYYFFIDFKPYRYFYYGLSLIAFLAFVGYTVLRRLTHVVYYYYAYLIVIFAVVLLFRQMFRAKYGRDWTYGVVEEIKGDLVRVFVHDDIAANVKPGYYWVDKVGDLKEGRIVKLLVEERLMKGAVPRKIMEVYLGDQSSQSSTEPKAESDSNSSR
ncbi:DUF2101 family protein [Thermococcus sp.]